jgi:SAM-dependent methyltransferase
MAPESWWLFRKIGQFNAAHPWSHNDVYHRWLLRQLPPALTRTIDLGCGTGNLVRAVAARAQAAEGIDADASVIATARRAVPPGQGSMLFTVGNFMELEATSRYDAVTAVAAIHHVPLQAGLEKARSLLVPGGTLVIIGCYRPSTAADRAVELVAIPANMAVGLWKTRRQAEARVAMSAPIAPVTSTLPQVRAVTAAVLPGASLRRRLFWRYSLTWKAPTGPGNLIRGEGNW